MTPFHFIISLVGLAFFEIISSIDNAVINAGVLRTLSERWRRWFLIWGFLIAVVMVRALLPWLIVFFSNTSLGFIGSLTATFSGDPAVREAIESSKPVLLIGGGIYLFFLFIHWLFQEKKEYAFFLERFIHEQAVWFYAVAAITLTVIVWFAIALSPQLGFAAVVGSTAFFLVNGFKESAEEKERQLMEKPHLSAISKLVYLEMIDASFSIDGVVGAFAFTLSVPLIILGNGLGAFVIRWGTIRGMDAIAKYRFLKNGAMYAIGSLGLIMIVESFGKHVPFWVPALNTFVLVAVFLYLSEEEFRLSRLFPLGKWKKEKDILTGQK